MHRLFPRAWPLFPWHSFDPAPLIALVREQSPELTWLPEVLATCTKCKRRCRASVYFIDPRRPNQPGSPWQFAENVVLIDPRDGTVVLDVLKGNRVGGVEYVDRL